MKVPAFFVPFLGIAMLLTCGHAHAEERLKFDTIDSMFGAGQIIANCTVDDQPFACTLDTGSNFTTLYNNAQAAAYPSELKLQLTSVSGESVTCDDVHVKKFALGSLQSSDFEVVNCPTKPTGKSQGLLGIDFLGQSPFYLDYAHSQLTLNPENLPSRPRQSFTTDPVGHILVPVYFRTYGKPRLITTAMWDTGASLSVVDIQFALAHPEYFTPLGQSNSATDVNNQQLESRMMLMGIVGCDGIESSLEYVMAIDFSAIHKQAGPQVNMILGHNFNKLGNWFIDVKNKQWFAQ